ncbi:hypothetical protein KUTeg_024601 [Tegillarca granosa]|uniref:Aminoacyl-tRNA synthetase class II (D/K/N) domain-containing protein n=1 Tax=Tegillarca granosa TaxID=220873 RepID=A0ABQ9DYU7_TEGGR|nr:hypothetical protein KUTeg_024601 [Tegillarca granosa]
MQLSNMSAPITRFRLQQLLRRFRGASSVSFAKYSSLRQNLANILSSDLSKGAEHLCAEGWVKSIRKYKDVTFLHLSDGSSPEYLQVLANQDLCSDVTYGSCISVTGNLAYPLHYKENESYDFLRSILHLKPKTKFTSSLLRENGFCYIHTPILTSNDCEGAGETFLVEPEKKMVLDELSSDDESETMTHFFRHPAYLSVSGQLQLEAVTGGFSRAYNFGPIMRADRSNTRYHLSEFYMIESEMAFKNLKIKRMFLD